MRRASIHKLESEEVRLMAKKEEKLPCEVCPLCVSIAVAINRLEQQSKRNVNASKIQVQ